MYRQRAAHSVHGIRCGWGSSESSEAKRSLERMLRRRKKPSSSSFTATTTSGNEQTSCAMDGVGEAVLESKNLHQLLVNDDEYSKLLASLDVVKQLGSVRADVVKSNAELARKNLEKAAEVIELQNQCAVIRTGELVQAMDRFATSKRRERQVLECSSPAYYTQQLDQATIQVDEQSETLQQMFLAGQITLQDFNREYRKQRALYHGRILTKLALLSCS